MKRILVAVLALAVLLTSCGIGGPATAEYKQITPEQAKEIMNGDEPHTLLDVRPKPQYDIGQIKGSISIPVDQVEALAEEKLPDKDALILVYGCNGTRSGEAARVLAQMGYTNVLDFGGIGVWPYGGMTAG